MSAPSIQSQQEPTAEEAVAAASKTTPHLPVVQFRAKKSLQVFFSTGEAARAAKAAPKDEFFDVRGIVLTRVATASGGPRLEARGKGNPGELKRRLMAELRRAAAAAPPGGPPTAAERQATLAWLEAAPSLEFLVHGLTLAPVSYDDGVGDDVIRPLGTPCDSNCSWLKRALRPGACC